MGLAGWCPDVWTGSWVDIFGGWVASQADQSVQNVLWFLDLPGTEVPLDVPRACQSGWVAFFPVEVGLLLELQGSGRLYWQISFFRGSAGFSFVSIQFAL